MADLIKIDRTYICPKCFRKETITSLIDRFTMYPTPVSCNVRVRFKNIDYSVYCKECKENMFECDELLTDPIIKLNQMGYETFYCCQGHHRDYDITNMAVGEILTTPYVYLNLTKSAVDILDELIDTPKYKNRIWPLEFFDKADIYIPVSFYAIFYDRDGRSTRDDNRDEIKEISVSEFLAGRAIFIEFVNDFIEALSKLEKK